MNNLNVEYNGHFNSKGNTYAGTTGMVLIRCIDNSVIAYYDSVKSLSSTEGIYKFSRISKKPNKLSIDVKITNVQIENIIFGRENFIYTYNNKDRWELVWHRIYDGL